jgi:hypothetical protein
LRSSVKPNLLTWNFHPKHAKSTKEKKVNHEIRETHQRIAPEPQNSLRGVFPFVRFVENKFPGPVFQLTIRFRVFGVFRGPLGLFLAKNGKVKKGISNDRGNAKAGNTDFHTKDAKGPFCFLPFLGARSLDFGAWNFSRPCVLRGGQSRKRGRVETNMK